jgi:hypothetical protein
MPLSKRTKDLLFHERTPITRAAMLEAQFWDEPRIDRQWKCRADYEVKSNKERLAAWEQKKLDRRVW